MRWGSIHAANTASLINTTHDSEVAAEVFGALEPRASAVVRNRKRPRTPKLVTVVISNGEPVAVLKAKHYSKGPNNLFQI